MTPHTSRLRPDGTTFPPVTPDPPPPPGYVDPLEGLDAGEERGARASAPDRGPADEGGPDASLPHPDERAG